MTQVEKVDNKPNRGANDTNGEAAAKRLADATAVLNVELQKVGKNNEETGMNGDMTAVVEASQVAAAANAEVHPEIAQANQERSQRERVDAAHNVIERNRQAHMNSGAWIPGQPVMNGLLPDFSKKK